MFITIFFFFFLKHDPESWPSTAVSWTSHTTGPALVARREVTVRGTRERAVKVGPTLRPLKGGNDARAEKEEREEETAGAMWGRVGRERAEAARGTLRVSSTVAIEAGDWSCKIKREWDRRIGGKCRVWDLRGWDLRGREGVCALCLV